MRWPPTYPGQLAPTTLPRVALLLPLLCPGFLARKDVSCPCSGGAKAFHCFTIKLVSSMLQWLPTPCLGGGGGAEGRLVVQPVSLVWVWVWVWASAGG